MKYPNINPEIINIYGPFSLRWYSLAYIIGFLFCSFFLKRELKHKLTANNIDSIVNYSIIGVILGARIGHIIFYDLSYYLHHLSDVLKIWQGGLSFHGGVVGLVLAILFFVRNFNSNLLKDLKQKLKNEQEIQEEFQKKKIIFFEITDIICVYVPFGIFFGRIANFINGELYGILTTLPIGMIFPSDPSHLPRHPVQLYESFFEGLVLFIIMIIIRKKTNFITKKGYFSCLFIFLYNFFRFFIEFIKEASFSSGYFYKYFTMGQILCIINIILVAALFRFLVRKLQN